VLLGIPLLIALSFEFVNGLHDTADAVAAADAAAARARNRT
jgi:phosphate/sulfate permease